jgi:hypothetical protein
MPISLQDVHSLSLSKSTALSGYYVPRLIPPFDVIRTLNSAGVRFVLVGAHGLGGWTGKPRAKQEVDVVVQARSHKKALQALCEEYPYLLTEDLEVVTRLRDPEDDKVRIDLMKPKQPIVKAALDNTHQVTKEGLTYQIPTLEMALGMKFAAMISLYRAEEDRLMDASDFISMVKAHPSLNLEKLAELGQLVYNGGGAEIAELVGRVRAGQKLEL